MIMILPHHKIIKVNGVEFCINDIDLEAERLAKLPQQGRFSIEVETVAPKKRSRKQQKSIDFSN
jgi:hypothetical protein